MKKFQHQNTCGVETFLRYRPTRWLPGLILDRLTKFIYIDNNFIDNDESRLNCLLDIGNHELIEKKD